MLYLQLVEVGQRRVTCPLAEQDGEVGGRIACVGGDLLQCQLFLDVLLHEMDGSRHDIVLFRLVAGGVTVLLQIAQCSEVVVEDGAGV